MYVLLLSKECVRYTKSLVTLFITFISSRGKSYLHLFNYASMLAYGFSSSFITHARACFQNPCLKTLFSLFRMMTILKNPKTWNSTFQTHWIKDIEVAKQTLNCVLLLYVETSKNEFQFLKSLDMQCMNFR